MLTTFQGHGEAGRSFGLEPPWALPHIAPNDGPFEVNRMRRSLRSWVRIAPAVPADVPQGAPASEPSASGPPSPEAHFRTTHWSVVLAARDRTSDEAQAALAALCQTYWYPLYAYVRRRGYEPADAEDLTQGFFERLLAKDYLGDLTPGLGRFRSFLLAALKHFLANAWDRGQARKRGGGCVILSLEDQDAERRYEFEPVDHGTPERLFERRWALTVLERVLGRLRGEYAASGKADLFDALKGCLSGGQGDGIYPRIAAQTGLKEGAARVAVHRLRRRYAEALRAEIVETVQDPAEAEDELRHFISVLSGTDP